MDTGDGSMPTRSVSEKWQQLQGQIYRALMDSPQGSELLQTAQNEEDFEVACSELAYEIMVHLGEGDVEPWTPEDRKNFQIELALNEYKQSYERLKQLRGW
jgi:hypothetical protein